MDSRGRVYKTPISQGKVGSESCLCGKSTRDLGSPQSEVKGRDSFIDKLRVDKMKEVSLTMIYFIRIRK